MLVFLEQVLTGEQDLAKCATKAYEDTLKKYHGWMVQKVFQVSDSPASLDIILYCVFVNFCIF